jgi:drug/metabolite transporter (DMT)-like permease
MTDDDALALARQGVSRSGSATPLAREPARWPGTLGLIVTVLIWGSTVPAISFLSLRWDPYFLAMIRYVAALPVFWLLLRMLERPGAPYAAIAWRRLMTLGAAMAAFATLYTLGIAYSHPATAVVFGASMPIVASLVARVVQGAAPSKGMYVGLVFVVPGAMLSMIDESNWNAPLRLRGGEPLIILAMLCWAWYSLMAQRWMSGASQLQITARTSGAASLVLLVVYGLAAAGGQTYGAWRTATVLDLSLIALLSYGVIVIAVVLWNNGVARLGLPLASMYLNLIPAVTLTILMAVGIQPSLGQVSGAFLVVAGILIAQLLNRRRK